MGEQTGPSVFHRVLRAYARAAQDCNLMMRASGSEHDWRLNELPEQVEDLIDDDRIKRVERAIDCFREIADDLEAGLRVELPKGTLLRNSTAC